MLLSQTTENRQAILLVFLRATKNLVQVYKKEESELWSFVMYVHCSIRIEYLKQLNRYHAVRDCIRFAEQTFICL